MSFCSYCNGLESSEQACPLCAELMLDHGKLSDYYAPYSPYREIDDLKLSNGYPDLIQKECLHFFECPTCLHQEVIALKENES